MDANLLLKFYIGAIVIGLATAVVLFLFDNRKNKSSQAPTKGQEKKSLEVLERLGLDPDRPGAPIKKNPEPAALNALSEPVVITTPPTETGEYIELKIKYDKLQTLLQEKTTELESKENALNNEIRHRKDFNKLKDILEKELKDAKDRNRQQQINLTSAQSEIDNHKNRVVQLEGKMSLTEKGIKEKEHQIDEMNKQLSTLTAALQTQREQHETQIKDLQEKLQKAVAAQAHAPVAAAEPKTEPSKPEIKEPVIEKIPAAPVHEEPAPPQISASPQTSPEEAPKETVPTSPEKTPANQEPEPEPQSAAPPPAQPPEPPAPPAKESEQETKPQPKPPESNPA